MQQAQPAARHAGHSPALHALHEPAAQSAQPQALQQSAAQLEAEQAFFALHAPFAQHPAATHASQQPLAQHSPEPQSAQHLQSHSHTAQQQPPETCVIATPLVCVVLAQPMTKAVKTIALRIERTFMMKNSLSTYKWT